MTTDPTCEGVLVAAMAMADGEHPSISAEVVEAHLAGCPSCRADVNALDATRRLLDNCQRRPDSTDLWPALSGRIGVSRTPSNASATWMPFLVLVGALVVARVLLAAAPDAVIVVKFLAAALVVATFVYARVNPFKIETGLRLGQE